MKKIFVISFALILIFSTSLYAEDYNSSLTVGIWTQHYDGDHCEGLDNHLLAIEHKGMAGAFFRNSYGNETLFLGGGWHTKKLSNSDMWVRANLYAGVLIGYGTEHPIHYGVFSPGIYPTFSIGRKNVSLEVGVMPTFAWSSIKVEF
jgi:hypothetical protein